MPAYRQDLERFAGFDAQVVGIGVDSVFCSIAWQKYEIGMLNYPLASDFWPHGDVARKYGVLRAAEPLAGLSNRAIFVVDKQGRIAFSKLYQISDVPPNEDLFEALGKLERG
ncbi:MAG: redoxin domain-containing protein [Acidobacteria bacterium]|nr:redoxin domain-containing protein [Acidobacteriota bacterium]